MTNKMEANVSFMGLREDNTLTLIAVSTSNATSKQIATKTYSAFKSADDLTCYDLLNPINNEIWVDCQYKQNHTNVIFRLYFSSAEASQSSIVESILTEPLANSNTTYRKLVLPVEAEKTPAKEIYRFENTDGCGFQINEFIFVNELNKTEQKVRTKSDFPGDNMESFCPRFLFAFQPQFPLY